VKTGTPAKALSTASRAAAAAALAALPVAMTVTESPAARIPSTW
jgi:hypothetical protein